MEKRKPLYIPIKTLDSEDYVSGIGILEAVIIGIALVITIIIGILLAIIFNSLVAIVVGIFLVATVVVVIKRDNTNENVIRKISIIMNFNRSQKRYSYVFKVSFDDNYREDYE